MNQPPFHDPNSQPLPDANDVEAEFREAQAEYRQLDDAAYTQHHQAHLAADKRKMRNFILGLLAVGLLVGGLLSVGLVWTLNQLNMTNPPALHNNQ